VLSSQYSVEVALLIFSELKSHTPTAGKFLPANMINVAIFNDVLGETDCHK
jgi:hypothetical protein